MRSVVAVVAVAGVLALALAGCGPNDPRLVAVPWSLAVPAGRTVTVLVEGSDCGRTVSHGSATETPATVTIAVHDRVQPLSPNAVCAVDLRIWHVVVHLRAPLGGRELEHAPVPSGPGSAGCADPHLGCAAPHLDNPPGALSYRARAEAICLSYAVGARGFFRWAAAALRRRVSQAAYARRRVALLIALTEREVNGLSALHPPPAFASAHRRAVGTLASGIAWLQQSPRDALRDSANYPIALEPPDVQVAQAAFTRLDLPACAAEGNLLLPPVS